MYTYSKIKIQELRNWSIKQLKVSGALGHLFEILLAVLILFTIQNIIILTLNHINLLLFVYIFSSVTRIKSRRSYVDKQGVKSSLQQLWLYGLSILISFHNNLEAFPFILCLYIVDVENVLIRYINLFAWYPRWHI